MTYRFHKEYPWRDPLDFLPALHNKKQYALLYSGRAEPHTGRYSFLGYHPAYVKALHRFEELPICDNTAPENLPQWIGYVGYPMRHATEKLQHAATAFISLADCQFIQYAQMLRFDHEKQTIAHFVLGQETAEMPAPTTWDSLPASPCIHRLSSNMDKSHYLEIIQQTKEEIFKGNFYQANITRKFFGECNAAIPVERVFSTLTKISPAPYSALIKLGGRSIISSSPECFLSIDTKGNISARPIKGSIKRESDAQTDQIAMSTLQNSQKDRAENLMIVDLMRHDFSRICKVGSIQVRELAQLYSYATIHHLVSHIEGVLRGNINMAEIFQACFPPGSMTGAPKIAAMQWCQQKEEIERGVYSGAIGWLGANNQADFSVVIRTIITEGNRFEFQVGGGIVADSTPESEWEESLAKAAALAKALGIDEASLKAL